MKTGGETNMNMLLVGTLIAVAIFMFLSVGMRLMVIAAVISIGIWIAQELFESHKSKRR